MRNCFLFFLLFALPFCVCRAQAPQAINKLCFYNLAFDNNGNAWYAFLNQDSTRYYLGSYKNADWDSVNIPLTVTGNTIYDLKIDSYNNIWIGCSKGFIKYNGTTFSSINHDTIKEFSFGKNDTIWGISTNDTSKGLIFKFDGTNFSYYSKSKFKDTTFKEIATADSGHIFLYGKDSLYEFKDTGWIDLSGKYPVLKSVKVLSNMVVDGGYNLWVAVKSVSKVYLIEFTGNSVKSYPIDMNGTIYHSIDVDKNNRIRYINNAGNICTFSPSTKAAINFLNDRGFPIDEHSKVKVDEKNFVWVYRRNYK